MISHKHKCIFIHIPKCAGSSINSFFLEKEKLKWTEPNYNVLYGWCPKRKIHLQHATTQQLIETELITKEQWNNYFKFTFVRNPWDRAYSDYLWMKKDLDIEDSFKNFIQKKGKFEKRLTNKNNINYRGDHLLNQTNFFHLEGKYKLNFIGRFENFNFDIKSILQILNIEDTFNIHDNKSKSRLGHYSKFYNNSKIKLISKLYSKDIKLLNYYFEDKKNRFDKVKGFFRPLF